MTTYKHVYFIRHGSTDGTTGNRQQGPETPLNDQGHLEAAKLAARAESLSFDTLFSSPATRAVETAEVVATTLNKEVITNPVFSERRRPSRFNGWDKAEPAYVAYRQVEIDNLHLPDWKFEDSESFTELVDRTKAMLTILEETEGDSMVVSHEYICKFMLTYILANDNPTPELWQAAYLSLRMSNAGMSVFRHCEQTGWELFVWNDHAHFAE